MTICWANCFSSARRFLKTKAWEKTERIVFGGGFRDSRLGELAIARAEILLKSEKCKIEMRPIRHHPDEAGLIGALHLAPSWIFEGHIHPRRRYRWHEHPLRHRRNMQQEVGGPVEGERVEVGSMAPCRSRAEPRAGSEAPRQELKELIAKADKEEFKLAPFIGIACPGDTAIVLHNDGVGCSRSAPELERRVPDDAGRHPWHDDFSLSLHLAVVAGSRGAADRCDEKTAKEVLVGHSGRISQDPAGYADRHGILQSDRAIVTTAATLHTQGKTDIQSSAQAAEALKPIAGPFAELVFALGIIGTGLLAIPVLVGSTAYAIGEGRRWKVGLTRKPREAIAFYVLLGISGLCGIGLNFTPIDPIKALYWSADINGVLAAPVMVLLMMLVRRPQVMGKLIVTGPLYLLGWLSTIAMAFCIVGMIATMFMSSA